MLLALLFIVPAVFSVGVSPPTVEEYFEPSLEKYINLKILNPEGNSLTITAYAQGDLEDYISFPTGFFEIDKDEKEKIFSYRIELPETLDKRGTFTTKIVILAIPDKSSGDTKITANTELVSLLKVMSPIGDKYVEGKLFVPGMETGKTANIVVEVHNLGNKRIESAIAVIDILTPFGDKGAILKSDPVSLMPKEKKSIIIPWTPTLGNGIYDARLTLIYDELNSIDTKRFSIGTPTISINDLSVGNFKLGGIAKFDLLLESHWNQLIPDAYAVMDIYGKDGTIYTTFKTSEVDIDAFGKQSVAAYWDTTKVITGKYDMDITLNYLGKTTEDRREITVSIESIGISSTGLVVQGGENPGMSPNTTNTMLMVIILLLITIIIIILFKKKKK